MFFPALPTKGTLYTAQAPVSKRVDKEQWFTVNSFAQPCFTTVQNIIQEHFFFLKRLYVYLFTFRERGRERERERNINVWLPLTWPPAGDLAHNPGMCPD